MNDTVITAIDAVQQLAAQSEAQVREIAQLNRHVEILARGTGAQATTIRNLRETAQHLQQQVMAEQYQGEVYKRQGRKTRNKVKALRQQLAASETLVGRLNSLLDDLDRLSKGNAEVIEAQNVKLRNNAMEIATLRRHLSEAIFARELPAPMLVVNDNPLRVQFLKASFGDPSNVQTYETAIAVNQLALNTLVPDMIIASGDEAAYRLVAKTIARKLHAATEDYLVGAMRTRRGALMGQFANTPSLAELPKVSGIRRFKLLAPLIYVDLPTTYVTVPKGFVTDGASVPRWLWFAIPPLGMTFRAAIVHDFLGDRLVNLGQPYPGFETQKAIDDLFLKMMVEAKVPAIQRTLMYCALRAVAKQRRLP